MGIGSGASEVGVIPSAAAFQAERRISSPGSVAREISQPAGENAGFRDDARASVISFLGKNVAFEAE